LQEEVDQKEVDQKEVDQKEVDQKERPILVQSKEIKLYWDKFSAVINKELNYPSDTK